jgi:glycosyltransferase involved in cell wall biosynthesis
MSPGAAVRSLAAGVRRRLVGRSDARRMFLSFAPERPQRGTVLLSYLTEPFLPGFRSAVRTHTHYWEVARIAETFLELGYGVDVIRWNNQEFVPRRRYDVLVDARMNLERLAPLLGPECLKIMHCDTAHWLFHMSAQYRRLVALRERRGVSLLPEKTVAPNRGIEHADCATILGNAFTLGTYGYAAKPMHPIPLSALTEYPWQDAKDFDACRHRFLWFGSGGLVHKGLDLVLEAFAGTPEYHLTVCGPISAEPEFVKVYERELYHTPNIRTLGWLDATGPEFTRLARETLGLVYPSCSEGSSGAVVTCLHAGLLPIVSYESGVNVDPGWGVVLRQAAIEEIRVAVRSVSDRPAAQLREMARGAWEFARQNHTRERFAAEYGRVLRIILGERAA